MDIPHAEGAGKSASFWNFSLLVYRLPGVAPVLLSLQDDLDADVNLILFGLWRGTGGLYVSSGEFRALDAEIREWREEIVRPARSLRRSIKERMDGVVESALYEDGKRLELQAEQAQQRRMYISGQCLAAGRLGENPDDALAFNLAAYADVLGVAFPDETVSLLLEACRGVRR
jgi:uncharacterized protein (TIGR02444 family)